MQAGGLMCGDLLAFGGPRGVPQNATDTSPNAAALQAKSASCLRAAWWVEGPENRQKDEIPILMSFCHHSGRRKFGLM